ncbi:MAG: hypothetical protein GY711_07490 [bacterium]|nr:hypothetical protein [bacterium]
MRVTCGACGAAYRVPDSAAGKAARCPSCDERFVVPDAPQPRQRLRREPPRTHGAIVPVAILVFLGALNQAWVALALTRAEGPTSLELVAIFGVLSAVYCVIGFGLLKSKVWSWWLAVLVVGAQGIINGWRLFYLLTHLRWGHGRAKGIALEAARDFGIPFAIALGVLVILFLPGVRIHFGLKDRPRERKRRAAGSVSNS